MPIRIHNLHNSVTSALDISSIRISLPEFANLHQLAQVSFHTIFLANGDKRYEIKSPTIPLKAMAYLFMGVLLLSAAIPFFRKTELLAYTGWEFILFFGFMLTMGIYICLKSIGHLVVKQTISFEKGKLLLSKSAVLFPVVYEIPLTNIDRISFEERWFFKDSIYKEFVPTLHLGKHEITFFEWAPDFMADEMKTKIEEAIQLSA
ncbi:MAG: hypothetical protein AAGC85_26735, partial [Bacteroidota bacterium]